MARRILKPFEAILVIMKSVTGLLAGCNAMDNLAPHKTLVRAARFVHIFRTDGSCRPYPGVPCG
jgi:hypothetical protein